LYFNHFPAAEIWSVVHLPLTLTRTRKLANSSPAKREKGSRTCNLVEVGDIMISDEATGWGFGGGHRVSSPIRQILRLYQDTAVETPGG
jgi:hypothetical protein